MARMLLNGESRFFCVCDINGLGVAKRSPATTSTLEARQRPSSHRGQTSATELRKVPTLSSLGCVEIVLVAIIVDPTAPVYSFQARRPATRMPLALPLLQQLQCRDSGFVQSRGSSVFRPFSSGKVACRLQDSRPAGCAETRSLQWVVRVPLAGICKHYH